MNVTHPPSMTSGAQFDPMLLAVMANRLEGICREMMNTLLRSGRSAVLSMARDFSCAIVTSENDLLVSAEGLPVHVIGMEFLAETMTELHPEFRQGDAFLHNDPYLGNTHPADHSILIPVFYEGEHLFTACAKAHQADCGNSQPTTYMPAARDVYEEGALIFPCVRIQQDYCDIEDIIRMCRRRIRVPDQWYGDYLAALGAARIGERRLEEFAAKYGAERVRAFVREWFEYSERRMVDAIRRLPSRTFAAEGTHDAYPGLPDGIPLKVTIDIDADNARITLDLRDNPDCYPGGLNQSRACATSNVVIGLFNSLDPDIPHNAGSFRRIDVLLREGSIAGIPVHPTSCSMATTNIGSRLINITQAAFADLDDGYGLAEGAVGLAPGFSVVAGRDWRLAGSPYVNQLMLGGGGGPGGPAADGWPHYLNPQVASLMYRDSIEVDEQKYPIHVYEQRLLRDSEGAGRFRGGFGTLGVFGPKKDPMTVAYSCEGHFNPPRGVREGQPSIPSDAWKYDCDGNRVEVPKVGTVELQPGERIASVMSGGGGYGNPRERDPQLVREDVAEGLISAERAHAVYGVDVSAGGPTRATAERVPVQKG